MAITNSKLKTQNSTLAALLLTFVALATLYSALTPLGEGPDEPGHAAYVFFLARERRLPDQRANEVPGEGHQPPLAYALAAPLVAWLPADQRMLDQPGNPRFVWAGGSEPNAVAHGSREYWPWRGAVLAWHLARLASVALGAATVAFTYLAAQAIDLRFTIYDLRLDSAMATNRKSKIVNRKWLAAQAIDLRFTTYDLRLDSAMATNRKSNIVNRKWIAAQAIDLRFTTYDLRLDSAMATNRKSNIVNRKWIAAALVALNPQFLFIAGLVTNDALLAALSALLLWLVVRGPRGVEPRAENQEPPRRSTPWRWPALLGLVLGLALLTKQSALMLVPIALLAVMWPAGRGRLPLRHAAASAVILLVVALLVSGWWYWRNWQLYGDPLGLAVFQAEFAGQPFEARSPAAWWGALTQLHGSFWARFGWMNVYPPAWVLGPFVLLELLALAGWVLLRRRDTRQGDREIGRQEDRETPRHLVTPSPRHLATLSPRHLVTLSRITPAWHLALLPALALAWLLSFALTAGLVAWQGRLLFPALPAIAILLALGLESLAVGSRQSAVTRCYSMFYCLLPAAYCLLALWLPFGVIRPAYPQHTLPEQAALTQLGTPTFGRLGLRGEPGAELRGWQLATPLQAGASADLTLMWHARGRQNRDWTVFVHLVDAQETIVAEANNQPRGGAFPMGQWVAGDWIADRHALAVPAGVPPGPYELRVGLYDTRTQRRTGVFSQRGRLIGDYLVLGQVEVVAAR